MAPKLYYSSLKDRKKKIGKFEVIPLNGLRQQKRNVKLHEMIRTAEEIVDEENYDLRNFKRDFNERCAGRIEGQRVYGSWIQFLANAQNRFVNNGHRFENEIDKRLAAIQRQFDANYCTSESTNSKFQRKPAPYRTNTRGKIDAKTLGFGKNLSNVMDSNENNTRTIQPAEQGRRKKSIPRKICDENSLTAEESSPLVSHPGVIANRTSDSLDADGEAESHMAPEHTSSNHQMPIFTFNAIRTSPYTIPFSQPDNIISGDQLVHLLLQNNDPTNLEGSQSHVVEYSEHAASPHGTPPMPASAIVSVSSSPVPPPPQIYNFIHPAPPRNPQLSSPLESNQPQNIVCDESQHSSNIPPLPHQSQQLRHADATNPPVIQLSSTASNQHPPQIVPSEISLSDDAATVSVSSSPVPPPPQIYNVIPPVPPQSLQPASPAASNQPQPVPQTPVPSTPSAPQQQQQLRHADATDPQVIQLSSTASNQNPPQIVPSETSQQHQPIHSNIPQISLPQEQHIAVATNSSTVFQPPSSASNQIPPQKDSQLSISSNNPSNMPSPPPPPPQQHHASSSASSTGQEPPPHRYYPNNIIEFFKYQSEVLKHNNEVTRQVLKYQTEVIHLLCKK